MHLNTLMKLSMISIAMLVAACSDEVADSPQPTKTVALGDLTFSDYVHDTLPEDLLLRIRAIRDVLEPVDGTSYEQAVDLYRRDQNPESEIVIWEEMALAYESFCEGGSVCASAEKQQEVYKALLLASMFPEEEVAGQLEPQFLTTQEIDKINLLFRLDPEPVKIVQE